MKQSRYYDEMSVVYVGLIVAIVAIAALYWHMNHGELVYSGLKWAWTQLGWLDTRFTHSHISAWRNDIVRLVPHSSDLTFTDALSILNRVGYLFILLPVLMTLKAVHSALTHKANRTNRDITVATLPRIMATHSPAIIPCLYYGDPDTLLLNEDPPEHRSGLTPQEWVKRNHLLVGGRLNRDACRDHFIADLGPKLTSLHDLSAHERALFVIFASRLFDKGSRRSDTRRYLDALNRSCDTHTYNGMRGYPDLTITADAFEELAVMPDAATWLERHKYARTMLFMMHKASLPMGKLPSAHFRWLKGMDRGLWYVLNNTGRKVAWIEAAAVYTQASWEQFAHDAGFQLTEPCVDDAIEGLDAYLDKLGILKNNDRSKS